MSDIPVKEVVSWTKLLFPSRVCRMDGDVSTTGMHAADDDVVLLESVAARSAAQMRVENFPVALRLLPRRAREDLTAVYCFARFVDDVGDEVALGADRRLMLLDAIDQDLHVLPDDRSTLSPVSALASMIATGRVPMEPFGELVEANRVDQRVTRYASFDDLLGYCRLSAAPIGRIVLHLAGAATVDNQADSDDVCAALQVLEHCQDVGEDAGAGRVYLPEADLRAEGVVVDDLNPGVTTPALRRVIAVQVARSRELLLDGRSLVKRLDGWARFAVAGFVAGGLATADALDAADHNILGAHIRPSTLRTVGWAARLLGTRR